MDFFCEEKTKCFGLIWQDQIAPDSKIEMYQDTIWGNFIRTNPLAASNIYGVYTLEIDQKKYLLEFKETDPAKPRSNLFETI